MKFFVVAILFALAEADGVAGDISCIKIRNVNYEKEILIDHVQSPYQLAIDHKTNTLFFSITARTDQMFESAYLNLNSGASGIVSGIQGGFSNAVNNKNNTVYMGGEDGVYEYDYETNTATNLHIMEHINIWQLFYKNGLYFTTYPEEKAYLYKNDEVKEVQALHDVKVMLLGVTIDMDIVYFNSSGVFQYDKNKEETVFLSNIVANGITADIGGNIFFSSPSGIYYLDNKIKEVEYLANIDNIYGIAIESNGNFIYATEDSLLRLKPTKEVCNNEKHPNNVVEIVIGQE